MIETSLKLARSVIKFKFVLVQLTPSKVKIWFIVGFEVKTSVKLFKEYVWFSSVVTQFKRLEISFKAIDNVFEMFPITVESAINSLVELNKTQSVFVLT